MKNIYLGIDTSNYTTSAALYSPDKQQIRQEKSPLTVQSGERGLRQSEAVFQHTVNLPGVITRLTKQSGGDITAVGFSKSPRDLEDSYMPCFLPGISAAVSAAAVRDVPCYAFSHQAGHIAAALFSAGSLSLLDEPFIAFHISGGTTESLLVEPEPQKIIKISVLGATLDLHAGQAVDRVGVSLGLDFPCGEQLENLANNGTCPVRVSTAVKQGNCCLSGLENQCAVLLQKGESAENIAAFCIEYLARTVLKMIEYVLNLHPGLPLVFSGGVMSNKIIQRRISEKYGAVFASPGFSSDNAAGIAVLAGIAHNRNAEPYTAL